MGVGEVFVGLQLQNCDAVAQWPPEPQPSDTFSRTIAKTPTGEQAMAKSERFQKGAAKMKELFGVEPQPGLMQEDFLNITVENLFGDIWNRPGL